MAPTGTLRTWNENRGFGFIAPTDGGHEIFVHISAFPRDGSRPTVGESLTYESGLSKDGRPQAVRVIRQAPGQRSNYRGSPPAPRERGSSSSFGRAVGLALLVSLGLFGYSEYQSYSQRQALLQPERPLAIGQPEARTGSGAAFRCDGRTDCSQMTSCAEAIYFLRHCPDARMDGDNDGVPCERQWCTSAFAR